MLSDYASLDAGTLHVDGEHPVDGRVQFQPGKQNYKGAEFHTEPLTQEQAATINDGGLTLSLLHGDTEIELGPEALEVGGVVSEGDEVVQLRAAGPEGWPLDL
ncbi:hypothetical protein [Glycomyces algeriensis]|uniref:Uncharacterized protein n=1 Tax=Glycomyces algeriensis TaxID=256037 RepID=A0A9W6GDB0_9ACTN|nr:hypothetical protein [Glycomyces algeriensis]MDA1367823.1 hypothetical protein [Glycomyces algeriensis]MDR7351969.1 hypothetical protein [Glycomyces algeriensis]GLI44702.1 hypothetical protein GALLR39Z86_45520 [Glycomyces algeriensis]